MVYRRLSVAEATLLKKSRKGCEIRNHILWINRKLNLNICYANEEAQWTLVANGNEIMFHMAQNLCFRVFLIVGFITNKSQPLDDRILKGRRDASCKCSIASDSKRWSNQMIVAFLFFSFQKIEDTCHSKKRTTLIFYHILPPF